VPGYTKLSLERLANAWLPLDRRYLLPTLLKEIAPEVAKLARDGVIEGVRSGVGPDGKPFKPLAHTRPGGGSKPLLDKGIMAASVSAFVTQDHIELRSNHIAAAMHQNGAVIRAKKQFLTIPVSTEAVRAGGARKFQAGRLFFLEGRLQGSGLLCERGANGGLKVHYVLKKEVRVPQRLWIGFSEMTELKIVRLVREKATEIVARSIETAAMGAKTGASTPGINRG